MEIKFLNVKWKDKKKFTLKELNISIKSNYVTGIYGDNSKIIPNLLMSKKDYLGKIEIENIPLSRYKKTIVYVDKLNKDTFLTRTVSDEFFLMQKKSDIKNEEYLAKVISCLKMVGLNKNYLKREISTLSKSEKRLVQIARGLVINPEIIIIDEPFLYLDKNNLFYIKKILMDLCHKYEKTVIILSQDVNLLYEVTTNLIIMNSNQVLASGKTQTLFKDTELLEKNKIPLPNLILFNKIALNYSKKLSDYKEVDDLIKGVYSSVYETKDET